MQNTKVTSHDASSLHRLAMRKFSFLSGTYTLLLISGSSPFLVCT